MKLNQHEKEALERLALDLKRRLGALSIILYGSAATGKLQRDSDIDLLVVLPDVNWEVEKSVGDAAFETGLEIGRLVSTMCFSEVELKDKPVRCSAFVSNVMRDGTAL